MTTLNITFESKAVKNYDNNYYRKYEKYTPCLYIILIIRK